MPKTKVQGILFGLIMSVSMAYGMEVYNIALREGGLSQMTNQVFWDACWKPAICGFLYSFFQPLGQPDRAQIGRLDLPSGGQSLCSHRMDLLLYRSGDVSYHERRSSHPVSVLLAHGSWTQLPAYWVGTMLKNFPMALLWNLFAAGPITRLLFRRIFMRHPANA